MRWLVPALENRLLPEGIGLEPKLHNRVEAWFSEVGPGIDQPGGRYPRASPRQLLRRVPAATEVAVGPAVAPESIRLSRTEVRPASYRWWSLWLSSCPIRQAGVPLVRPGGRVARCR